MALADTITALGDSIGTAPDPDKFVIADMTDGRYLMGSAVADSRRNNNTMYRGEILR